MLNKSHSNPIYRTIDFAIRSGLRTLPVSKFSENLALWWGYRFRPPGETVRLRSGARINVFDTEHSQLLMRYLGTFEPHSLAYLRKYARSGSTIIDVGANIGLYTVEASRAVGPSGRVISIEAAPIHAMAVKESVQLNGACNVTVINIAVGDEDGEAILTLPSDGNMGMFTLGAVKGTESYKVPVRTIDAILAEQNVTAVDFIKMDIEGSEFRALSGAKHTLGRYHPPILIELNETALLGCGSSTREVKELLTSFGYQGFLIKGKRLLPILLDQKHDVDECMFIFGASVGQ